MNRKKIFSVLVTVFALLHSMHGVGAEKKEVSYPAHISQDSGSFFDDLEAQALTVHAFDTVEHKDPHPLMVFLRIVSSPLINTYFALSQRLERSWCFFMNCFKKKTIQES